MKPSPRTVNDARQWEFSGGHDARGRPVWTRDFSKIKPLADWDINCGNVSITCNPPHKKYPMSVTDGGNTISKFSIYFLYIPSAEPPGSGYGMILQRMLLPAPGE